MHECQICIASCNSKYPYCWTCHSKLKNYYDRIAVMEKGDIKCVFCNTGLRKFGTHQCGNGFDWDSRDSHKKCFPAQKERVFLNDGSALTRAELDKIRIGRTFV